MNISWWWAFQRQCLKRCVSQDVKMAFSIFGLIDCHQWCCLWPVGKNNRYLLTWRRLCNDKQVYLCDFFWRGGYLGKHSRITKRYVLILLLNVMFIYFCPTEVRQGLEHCRVVTAPCRPVTTGIVIDQGPLCFALKSRVVFVLSPRFPLGAASQWLSVIGY